MYDILNICNAECTHCPQRALKKSELYSPTRLSWERFEKSLTEAAKYKVDVVRITGDGEPLLHPDIVRMISLGKALGFPCVNLTTNGSLLKDSILQKLLKNPPHVFDISLDAFHPETYRKVRIGLDFNKVKSHIFNLLEQRNPEETKIVLSMVKRPGLDGEVEKFKDYWEDKVDLVAIRELHTNLGQSVSREIPDNVKRWPCQHLWQRLVVDYRGLIRFCPVDWTAASRIGSIDDMTLHNAWHSDILNKNRDNQLSGVFDNCQACCDCNDWFASPWEGGWLKLINNLILYRKGCKCEY
jgi:MoaA/NifB/PqqE/SkfB family radical SAM enzyme